ncbi:MAG: hypothetical protein ACLQT6_09830 [Desulfomonilaceae bacterium]
MGRFVKGTIVVVNYFFTDLSGSKRRPAVVIADLEGNDLMNFAPSIGAHMMTLKRTSI